MTTTLNNVGRQRVMCGEMNRRLCYISLESLRPATAANTHVRGVLQALQGLGWQTILIAEVLRNSAPPGFFRQSLRYLFLQIAAGFHLRKVDVVYVRQHFATVLIVGLARLLRRPVVLELNGLPSDVLASHPWLHNISAPIHWCYRLQFRFAQKILVVTEGLATYVGAYTDPGKIIVVPNGADADLFCARNQPRPTDVPDGRYVVLFGDFAIWHDVQLLINATADPAWPDGVKVVLIGRGSREVNLLLSTAASAHVKCLDWVEQDKLVAYVVHAMAGIIPIATTGQRQSIGAIPLKFLEVLSCGRPAIVSDLPTLSDLTRRHDCGLVFAHDDANSLARAVSSLAADPMRANDMGVNGRALVEATHNWKTIAAAISDILKRLIAPQ